MRKSRSDSRFARLSADQRKTLWGWFEANLSYEKMIARCKSEFGVQTSESGLRAFYRRHGINVAVARGMEASTIRAGGVEILITIPEPGKISLAIRPLAPAATPSVLTTGQNGH